MTIKKLCEEIIKAGQEVLELNGEHDIRFVLEDRLAKWEEEKEEDEK